MIQTFIGANPNHSATIDTLEPIDLKISPIVAAGLSV